MKNKFMDTLLVIIFVFILKTVTFLLPEILILIMFIVVAGFSLGVIRFFSGKQKSIFPDAKEMILSDIYHEILKRKEQKQRKNIADLYLGELHVEDARTNSNNKK